MLRGRTTLSKFLIEQLSGLDDHSQLAGLLVDVAAAIKGIAAMTAKGALETPPRGVVSGARSPTPLEAGADEEILRSCDWGGLAAGLASKRTTQPHAIPADYKRGRYLLCFDPLAGAANFDVNMPVGTIFSVLHHMQDAPPDDAAWLRPGRELLAAGYAIYGPATMLVLTVGKGTHGFTLDREIGNFILTHPELRIPEDTGKFAVNTGNERHWESPVRRYVEECKAGRSGIRGRDFSMRWIASMVADVHRILLRGGVFMCPRGEKPDSVQLVFEAAPVALLIEQAGGLASTGRQRVLDATPAELHDAVPVFLGSRNEIERIERYHHEFDIGTDKPYESPLFKERSLYREGVRD
ncbi:MAG TPA: class 1 fructose-bisphosphatase [Verrucomicrobiae bacterium]|nr:class 1 fructose-bisphosphatase [Verrucomicrobiae bacterium]